MPGSGNLLPLANLTVRFHHGDGCAKTSRLHQLFGAVWLGVVGEMAMFQQLQCGAAPLAANLLNDKPDDTDDYKNLRKRPGPSYQYEGKASDFRWAKQFPVQDSEPTDEGDHSD